jgi:hypothetical protein
MQKVDRNNIKRIVDDDGARPILGLSGHPILSGVEHNYVNKSWNRPTNAQAYMQLYVEALRAQSSSNFRRGRG